MKVQLKTPFLNRITKSTIKLIVGCATSLDNKIQTNTIISNFTDRLELSQEVKKIQPFLNERVIKATLARCIPEENRRRMLPRPTTLGITHFHE
jgi:hypothetical protein